METKIQELTDKLFLEGVEKGEVEAARLIEEAQNRRQTIIENARQEAQEIMAKADKNASELKKNTEAELKLYATQAVEALKSEITNLITDKLVSSAVQSAFDSPDFMRDLMLQLVSGWGESENLVIQTDQAEALKSYFDSNAKELLDKQIKIEEVNGKKHQFSIAPANGGYKINFGEDEFIEYFKEFLRPQLIETLFGKQ